MTRANLNKSERPESASIEIPPFRPHFIKISNFIFHSWIGFHPQKNKAEIAAMLE